LPRAEAAPELEDYSAHQLAQLVLRKVARINANSEPAVFSRTLDGTRASHGAYKPFATTAGWGPNLIRAASVPTSLLWPCRNNYVLSQFSHSDSLASPCE
jgi:NADH dehydrogenase FAD-containing subunit